MEISAEDLADALHGTGITFVAKQPKIWRLIAGT
jgi:hypothetical protein